MKGTIAVKGMAAARANVIFEKKTENTVRHIEDIEKESERLNIAKEQCAESLTVLSEELDAEHAEILDFQILLLEDDNYFGSIKRMVENEKVSCEYAVSVCSSAYRKELLSLDNPYLNERAADITDIEKRLLRTLEGRNEVRSADGLEIVVAEDLTPSQVVEFGRKNLCGIVLEKGGLSSHCVILARSMDIPCLIGVNGILSNVRDKDELLLDALHGEVIVNPAPEQLQNYKIYQEKREAEKSELEQYRKSKTRTRDGHKMRVYANISTEAETEQLLYQGGEGVGLMRTEMLYMERPALPDEDTQYAIYSRIVKNLAGRPVIIRTLDVGGDKHIPYLGISEEDNPFLGYRAIRYCLDNPVVLQTQAAAILRSALYGPVQLMLPMISTVSEVERAKEIIEEAKQDLARRGLAYGKISVGMMVETPAAAVMAEKFAHIVDFFSIGTNDLTQYLFAADRNNAKVSSLNSYFQPALLRVLWHICRCAHGSGIEVDICGQAGEVEELIPLWVGMGMDNLSVSIPSIPRVRRAISRCGQERCKELLEQAVACKDADEVKDILRKEAGEWL